jgi:hypothetical protein
MPVVEIWPPVVASPWTAVSLSSSRQITPPEHVPFARRDRVDPFISAGLDHQPAVRYCAPGHVAVHLTAHGDLEPALPEPGALHQRCPRCRDGARSERGLPVDQPVVNLSRLVVASVPLLKQPAGKRLPRAPLGAHYRALSQLPSCTPGSALIGGESSRGRRNTPSPAGAPL